MSRLKFYLIGVIVLASLVSAPRVFAVSVEQRLFDSSISFPATPMTYTLGVDTLSTVSPVAVSGTSTVVFMIDFSSPSSFSALASCSVLANGTLQMLQSFPLVDLNTLSGVQSVAFTGNFIVSDVNFFQWNCSGANTNLILGSVISSVFQPYLLFYSGEYNSGLEDSVLTRIISVTPADGATVATSTTFAFGVTGYISEDDYTSGSNVRVDLHYTQDAVAHFRSVIAVPACNSGLIPNTNICDSFVFPLTGAGSFSFSTTTFLASETGRYLMTTSLNNTRYWIVPNFITSTSTRFTVVQSTGLNILQDAIEAQFNALSASTTLSLLSCNPLGGQFDVLTCSTALLIPPTSVLVEDLNVLRSSVFNRVPFGYVTRLATILNMRTPLLPVPLTYSFGTSSPAVLQAVTAGDPITFQIYDHFDELNNVRADDGSNKNIWEIVMPYFTPVIYLAMFLAMLSDLMGLRLAWDMSQARASGGAGRSSSSRIGGSRVRGFGDHLWDGTHRIKVSRYKTDDEARFNSSQNWGKRL